MKERWPTARASVAIRPRPYGSWEEFLGTYAYDAPRFCHPMEHHSASLRSPRSNLVGFPWLTLVLGTGYRSAIDLSELPSLLAAQVKEQLEELKLGPAWDAARESLGLKNPTQSLDHLGLNPADEAGGTVPGTAGVFVEGLARDRLRLKDASVSTAHGSPLKTYGISLDPTAAPLSALALLLTDWYHLAEESHRPLARWGADLVRCSSPDEPPQQELRMYCAVLIQHLLAQLPSEATSAIAKTLRAKLGPLQSNLRENPVELKRADIYDITELAWVQLTRDLWKGNAVIYPSWVDLLLSLSMEDTPIDSPRPLFGKLGAAAQLIEAAFRETTEASLKHRIGAFSPTEVHGVHEAAAECLALMHGQWARAGTKPPPVTALVTSFDLELEIALWLRGQPFTVALPVYVVDTRRGGKEVATPTWVAFPVDPPTAVKKTHLAEPEINQLKDQCIAALTKPAVDQWVLLASRGTGSVLTADWPIPHSGTDGSRAASRGTGSVLTADLAGSTGAPRRSVSLGTGPVIVRLSGSPLVQLPDLQQRAGDEKRELTALGRQFVDLFDDYQDRDYSEAVRAPDSDSPATPREDLKVVLRHAVVVSELDAMYHGAIQLAMSQGAPAESELRHGLPAALTSDKPEWRRYWAWFGVQVSDAVIRNRLAVQMITPDVTDPDVTDLESAGRRGVVADFDITDLEHYLLLWLGFDVVRETLSEEKVTAALSHYSAHLRLLPGDASRTGPRERCGLE
jgi:hypothetical protein